MRTIIKICDPQRFSDQELMEAAHYLQKGEIVAFPTETVYGLGANTFNKTAVEKIFAVKGRPPDNPMIVHIASWDQLLPLVTQIPSPVKSLTDRFWPGPLTILFQKKQIVPDIVTAGLPTVAIRMPAHPIARSLIRISKFPISAPSANLSGRPSPTTAGHVLTDFDGKIPYIIDGGPTNVGLESTVIDIQRDPPLILRPGGITLEMLREFLPTIRVYNKQGDGGLEIHPPTPGMKYRHYAPHAQLLLLIGDPKKIHTIIVDRVNKAIQNGKRVGILQTHPDSFYTELSGLSDNCLIINLGPASDLALIAQNLFRGMRDLDAAGVEIIFAEGVGEINEGLAIMNRLRKAASEEINVNELKS